MRRRLCTLGSFLFLVPALFLGCHSKKDEAPTLKSECVALADSLCAAVGPNTDRCVQVLKQAARYSAKECQDLMKDVPGLADTPVEPAPVRKLSDSLQARIAAPNAPSFGPTNSKVTIVEFSDFECPFCARAAKVVQQLRSAYGDTVHFVFRQYPLPDHEHARAASEASLAAFAQGKFWEYHDRLFEHPEPLDKAALESEAKPAGLDLKRFRKALVDSAIADAVAADMKLGDELELPGTPSFFMNGEFVADPLDFKAFSAAIDGALKTAPASASASAP